jgi:hypothetical protein
MYVSHISMEMKAGVKLLLYNKIHKKLNEETG